MVAPKVGGEFLVNTVTASSQQNSKITTFANGDFVVTWEDIGGSDGSGAGIKAQLFAANGGKIGTEFRVNTTTASNQTLPAIEELTAGGFVVVWQDASGQGGDASGSSIKAQMFDAAGGKIGGERLVNTTTAGNQSAPSITALANGGFVVTWQDASGQGGDTSGSSIKTQVFDASGGKLGTEFLVNTATAGSQSAASITALANGGFVVTWQDASGQGGDASGSSIKAQMFDAAGGKVGGERLVNTTTAGNQSAPSITALTNGGFVVTWQDASAQGDDTSGTAIKAQVFDAHGDKAGAEFLVNTSTTNDQSNSSITALANGNFVVTWEDLSGQNGDISGFAIKAQMFNAAGGRIGGEFLLNTTTSGNQSAPSIAALADGGFIVTWSDGSGRGGDTSGTSIKAQRFTLGATAEDTPLRLNVSATLIDTDGSETLTLAASGIPVGATLSDGVHTFTASAGNTSVDITGWTLANLTVTPPLNFTGNFKLTVTATTTDTATLSTGAASSTATTTQTINITVTNVNDAPIANADLRTTNEDTPLVIAASSLTANDTDVDGDTLTVTSVSNASHGTVALVNGIVTFTPDANFSGIARFDYTVSDAMAARRQQPQPSTSRQ